MKDFYAKEYPALAKEKAAAAAVNLAGKSLRDLRVAEIEQLDMHIVDNKVAAYRAPGAPMAAFAVESAIDDLALQLQIDPIELRLKNAFVPGDLGMAGTPFLNCELAACLAMMERGVALPTHNLERPAPECEGLWHVRRPEPRRGRRQGRWG